MRFIQKELSRERVIFLLLLLFTIFTRFWQIGQDSLWLDEGLSIRLSSYPLEEIFKNAAPIDHNPPLYLYLLHFWLALFGKSEVAARSLSALCNITTLPLLYLLAKRLFSNKVALLSGLFFAISPFQIYYAQESRVYALHAFLALLSIYSFLRLQEDCKLQKWAALWLLSSIALVYTHIYAWFILLFQGLYWLYLLFNSESHAPFKKLLLLNVLVVFAFIPYALHLVPLVLQIQKHYWISKPGVQHLIATYLQFGGGYYLGVPMLLFAMFGIYKIYHNKSPRSFFFLAGWLIIPVLVPFLLSLLLKPFFLTRYPIAAAGSFYIFAALGLQFTQKPIRIAAIVFFLAVGMFVNLRNGFIDNRAPWRTVAKEVAQLADSQTLVVIGADFCKRDIFDYYAKELSAPVLPINREVSINEIVESIASGNPQKLLFIASHFGNSEQQLVDQLMQYYNLTDQKTYPHFDLFDRRQVFISVYEFTKI